MTRLTKRYENGEAYVLLYSDHTNLAILKEYISNKQKEVIERLAAYEDTGLTPEEIMDGKLLTGWISFSEKMPAEDEEILVSNGEWVDIDTMAYDVDGWYLDSGRDFEGLAWMPLPEPWEGAK